MASRVRAKRLRRGVVLGASAILHVGLFFVAFSRAAGDVVSAGDAGGGPMGPVFAVTLVQLQAPPAERETATDAERQFLRMKIRAQATAGIPVSAQTSPNRLASLAERLTAQQRPTGAPPQRFPADREQPQGAYVPDPTRLSDARSRKTPTDLATAGDAAGGASTGALWGAIEPCWRNMGFRGQVPVVIEVTVDGQGGLRRPPTVIRSSSAMLTDVRLRSEANALAALTACMPRGDVRMAASSYRLEFPATP